MSGSEIFKKFRNDQSTQLILIGLLIGVLSGLAAVLYRWLIEEMQRLFFGGGGNILTTVQLAPWWRRIIMPTLGGLLVGLASKYFLGKEGASHGVPDVM